MSTHFHSRLLPLFCSLLFLPLTGCPFFSSDEPIITDCNTFTYQGHSYPNQCFQVEPGPDCDRQFRVTAVDGTEVVFTADLVCALSDTSGECCLQSVTIVGGKASREELPTDYNFITAKDIPQDDGSVITVEYFAAPGATVE